MTNELATLNERRRGYVACDCKRFAFVFDRTVLQRLPANYDGELCRQCGQWMCDVLKLEGETQNAQQNPQESR